MERYPEKQHWACASQRLARKRAMEAMRKRLIVEEKEKMERKKIYNDDLAA